MMNSNTYLLVMAGGKGTRLWPESTSHRPKQYLSLFLEHSLLEETMMRFDNVIATRNRFIITTNDQRNLALEHAGKNMQESQILIEPEGRDTAPCILLSLAQMERKGAKEDDVIAIMPADHVIIDRQKFKNTLNKAVELCKLSQTITTIGIYPHSPNTGYGYIEVAKEHESKLGFNVKQFREKPNLDQAKAFLENGSFYWNAGMFMATLGVFKSELQKCSPELYRFYPQLLDISVHDLDRIASIYKEIPKISIDYALMEKSNRVTLCQSEFDWNDLGSWAAIEESLDQNDDNVIIKDQGHYFIDSSDNIIFCPHKFVALKGISNKVIVVNDDAVLIMDKNDSQSVKEIVAYLKSTEYKNLT